MTEALLFVNEQIVWTVIQAVFLVTWVIIGTTTFWVYIQVRKAPPELIQLGVFKGHETLKRAFLFIGLGMMAGLADLAPGYLFSVEIPLAWDLTLTLTWALLSSYGYLSLARVFSIPTTKELGGGRWLKF